MCGATSSVDKRPRTLLALQCGTTSIVISGSLLTLLSAAPQTFSWNSLMGRFKTFSLPVLSNDDVSSKWEV
jgi:hypothetical protein